jgi:hypothetical protein
LEFGKPTSLGEFGIGPIIASAMIAAIGNGVLLQSGATLPPGLAWCLSRLFYRDGACFNAQ